jgi:maltose-binding protein MalE
MMLALAVIAASVVSSGFIHPLPSAAQDNELVIWMRDDLQFDWSVVSESFENDYNIRLVVEVMPYNDIQTRFPEEASSGNPDIIASSDDFLDWYVGDGLIHPLDLGSRTAEFIPFAISASTRNGELYQVPYVLENLALVRNPDLVPDPPPTWDAVAELSAALVGSGAVEYGFVLQDYDLYHYVPILSAFGGYFFGIRPDGTFDLADLGLNNDGALAAATWLYNMGATGHLPNGMDWETAHAAFETGRAAMIITGPWAMWRFDEAKIPYAVSAFPSGIQPGRPFVHVQGFMLNAYSDNIDAAYALLIEYLPTEPHMKYIADSVGRVPAHIGAFEQMENPALIGFGAALLSGQPYPAIPETQAIWDNYTGAIQQVRQNEVEPRAALDAAVDAIRAQNSQ